MTLIKSISGIRGTIGGTAGDNLTPRDVVECSAAFGHWSRKKTGISKIVVGRDARMSGEMVNNLVVNTLRGLGIDVVDLGLSTTPTVEVAVPAEKAAAGIIITASHNPRQWNALKFINEKGEFISAQDGQDVLDLIDKGSIEYAPVDQLGTYRVDDSYIQKHIEQIFALELVEKGAIIKRKFKVIVDCVNSTGAISVPVLLEQLGCEVIVLNGEMTGDFAHNPEPLPENLKDLSESVVREKADLGISVDPDVDRLALVCENGEMFGEEYTLVAVADYVLQNKPGNTVSNLSSTRALRDVTQKSGGQYYASAVGEVNVVTKMKEVNAVIGGEGNGGVIVPELHYGRDALAGIALFLSLLVKTDKKVSALKESYPSYVISKNKIQLTPEIDLNAILSKMEKRYATEDCDTIDGLKINFSNCWVHLRKSNTEPIIRIYTEAATESQSNELANKIMDGIKEIIEG
ncbi:MAG: phosphoglucosamine mutase [Bacteroidetes bacterium]|nr:phosphoglucosamine mutase [Bacteroidota bacterium]